jgi:hypothetical protein
MMRNSKTSLCIFTFFLSSVSAFVPLPANIQNGIARTSHRALYDDGMGGNGEYPKVDVPPRNEWGIPDSKTLEPFCDTPVEQLENGGRISLIGSGPGDPELLTVKAFKMLQDPEALVISDRLVSPEILDLVKGEVKIARKLPGCAELAQEEIHWWTHQGLAQGKHVIRLKIGDPFVFGRGAEEILKFRSYGVESNVVPVGTFVEMTTFLKFTTSHLIHLPSS